MKAEEYSREPHELAGWPVVVETYRLGAVYHCTISNADPGARIARADGATKEEAEQKAIEKATRYLGQTRKLAT
ncbi:MAG: hypothetical protein ABI868_16780 [Acidobacteriota bacterium]